MVERGAPEHPSGTPHFLAEAFHSMQCNIDNRGRVARIITGLLTAVIGAGLIAAWQMGSAAPWGLWVGIGTILGGAFAIFEGVKGWCVMRAMGFKTPM